MNDAKDAARYRYMRALLWNVAPNPYNNAKLYLWSTRFSAEVSDMGDVDAAGEAERFDSAIDWAIEHNT